MRSTFLVFSSSLPQPVADNSVAQLGAICPVFSLFPSFFVIFRLWSGPFVHWCRGATGLQLPGFGRCVADRVVIPSVMAVVARVMMLLQLVPPTRAGDSGHLVKCGCSFLVSHRGPSSIDGLRRECRPGFMGDPPARLWGKNLAFHRRSSLASNRNGKLRIATM